MNNEVLLPAVVGITIGLLLVVAAGYRSSTEPAAGVWRRAAALGLLVYAVASVPFFARGGLTLPWLLALLVILGLVLAVSVAAGKRQVEATSGPQWVRAVVGVCLTTVMLISAGQTLALLTRVDPRMVVVVLAVIVGLIVGLEGMAAAGRIASTTIWILIIPVLISLALGLLLGGFAEVVTPIVGVPGPSAMTIVALTVSLLAIGWADPGLQVLTGRFEGRSAARIALPAGLILALVLVGQLMFLGGSLLAPSMQFFVVPSNIDILPALAAVLLAIATMVFAGLIAVPLAGVRTVGGGRWVAAGAAVAAIIALVDPGAEQVIVSAGLAGVALLGATLARGDLQRGCAIGLAAAVVATLALIALGQWQLGLPSLVATVIVAAIAAATSRISKGTPAPVA